MTRAYSEFMKGEIAKVKAANPDATPTEVFKTAANHWKQHCRDGPPTPGAVLQVMGFL